MSKHAASLMAGALVSAIYLAGTLSATAQSVSPRFRSHRKHRLVRIFPRMDSADKRGRTFAARPNTPACDQ